MKSIMRWARIHPEDIFSHLPIMILISAMFLINIANGYIAQSKISKIQKLEKELKESRWNLISIQANNLSEAKESQIAKRVEPLNLEVSKTVPKTIVIP